MKGEEKKLISYMAGAGKRFVIPVYQRNYDWKVEHCKQLFDDLKKIKTEQRNNHFFGSIVSVYNPDGDGEEYQIIDGQQRLTTVSLLLLAMYNLLINNKASSSINRLSEKIYEEYLVDKYQDEDKKIKLKSVKDDQKAFKCLFGSDDEYIQSSNITINYNYFFNRLLEEKDFTLDDVYNAIVKLEIIEIKLNLKDGDNPQLIFESLNSTGLELSEGDKIRNFILMDLPTNQQNSYYEKYWNKIEIFTNYDVSSFIRDYLSVKQQRIPSFNSVYKYFKKFFEESNDTLENILTDILAYAKRYSHLIKGDIKHKKLDASIFRLNKLETTVTRPFFLELLRLYETNKLSLDELSDIFIITESYLFRRTICNLPTNALNNIFLVLHNDIINYDDTEDNYKNKFIFTLLTKKGNARFPTDEEFINYLSNAEIYPLASKNKLYIFERLENFGTNETKNIFQRMTDGDYTIEHIMPKKLTLDWRKELGDQCDDIHSKWLHKLANLTITAYNSKYSNLTFHEKKTMEKGFIDSGIILNQYIAKFSKWTEDELIERNNFLMKRALEIWPIPQSDYMPKEKQYDSFSLEDDYDPTGQVIVKYSYNNMEQAVSTWVDMYVQVIKTLHSQDNSILFSLADSEDDDNELARHVKWNERYNKRFREIDNNLFIYSCIQNTYKLNLIKKIFCFI